MGRPRKIAETDAIARALRVFWEKGYDRASINDLGQAVEMGPSSLYNAFGSKAALFEKTLEHYVATHTTFVDELLGANDTDPEPTLRRLLHAAVALYTSKNTPRGCAMMEGGGVDASPQSEGGIIARRYRQSLEKTLRAYLQKHPARHLSNDPAILAKYLVGMMRGLSQLARDGTAKADLQRIADQAVASCFRG